MNFSEELGGWNMDLFQLSPSGNVFIYLFIYVFPLYSLILY